MYKTSIIIMIVSIRKYLKINCKEMRKHELNKLHFSILTSDINFSALCRSITNITNFSKQVWLNIYRAFYFLFFLLFIYFFKFIFSFSFISWRLITLQYCSGFCHTLTWISHGFTCVPHPEPPSCLPLHPIPLGLPSAPALSTCLMHPTWAGDLFHPW